MLNWLRLRRALADYRVAKSLSVAKLAEMMDVAPTTIYRAENVTDEPDYQPELQTIADWLQATGGPGLAAFFARVDAESVTVGEPIDDATTESTQPETARERPYPGVPADDDQRLYARLIDACLSAADVSERAISRAILEELAVAFSEAADRTLATREAIKQRIVTARRHRA